MQHRGLYNLSLNSGVELTNKTENSIQTVGLVKILGLFRLNSQMRKLRVGSVHTILHLNIHQLPNPTT